MIIVLKNITQRNTGPHQRIKLKRCTINIKMADGNEDEAEHILLKLAREPLIAL